MRITNLTHWDTRDISRLIYRVAQDELDPGQLKRARIRIKYRRSNGGWGNCTYGTGLQPRVNMMLGMPRDGKPDTVQLANIIAHEFGHAKGLRHRDMNNTRYGWVEGWRERYAWAESWTISMKSEPTKDEKLADRRTRAEAKAQKMVRKWTTASKRADTMLKKWQTRLKRAERRKLVGTGAIQMP